MSAGECDPRREIETPEGRARAASNHGDLLAEVMRLRAKLYGGCPDCGCTLVDWHHTTECPKWDAQGNPLPCTGETEFCPAEPARAERKTGPQENP